MVPLAFTNPLYHASASQRGLELLFAECAADPACHKAFPNIETEFNELMHKLQRKPVTVSISHPETKEKVSVILDKNDFAEAVRMMLYRLSRNRRLPYLIHRAYLGEFQPFAQLAVQTNREINNILSMGLLLCVTCSEDVDRITEEAIIRETRNTFLGDVRVREQKAACRIWPRSKLPEGYSQPIKTEIPVLILSGTIDPVTPPRFGELAAKNMPNALHLVVPGTHGVFSPCQTRIELQFLNSGTVRNLNTECIKTLKLPPLFISKSR
jgi:pimeloyl-ACP methyl ester carboxylesterase